MKRALLAALAATPMVSAASAADLYVEPEVIPEIQPVYDWSGGYVGVIGGYGWGGFSYPESTESVDAAGWLIGLEAGANWQMDSIVLGLEADIAWTDINGEWSNIITSGIYEVNWLGTVTARAGLAADRALLYVEGGLAYAELHQTSTGFPIIGGAYDQTSWDFGWTVGAGVEYAVTDDLSVKLEYNYIDITGWPIEGADPAVDVNLAAHVVKAGLNWQF